MPENNRSEFYPEYIRRTCVSDCCNAQLVIDGKVSCNFKCSKCGKPCNWHEV